MKKGVFMDYAYYNGIYLPYGEMKIPLCDRSIYFADAIYEVMIGRKGRIYQLQEHIERLKRGAELLEISLDGIIDRIESVCLELIRLSDIDSFVLYLQVSRNANKRRHFYTDKDEPTLLMTITEFQHATGDNPLKLISTPDKRYEYCNIKTTNLFPAVIASSYAERLGCEEALFHKGGTVTECSRSNISICVGDRLITHPEGEEILPGITRRNLIEASVRLGLRVEEEAFTLSDIENADEVIVSSTTKFIKRASKLDSKDVGMKNARLFTALSDVLTEDFYRKTE